MSNLTDPFTTSDALAELIQGIKDRLYGTQEEFEKKMVQSRETFRRLGLADAKKNYPGYFVLPTLGVTDESGSWGTGSQATQFYLDDPITSSSVFRFTLQRYPACCGILMFHHFSTNGKLTNEEWDSLLNTILSIGETHLWGMYTKNRRINVVMVQKPPETEQDGQWIVNANYIQHKPLYDYFMTKKVNTRLMYNTNSNNLLHDMEVIL